MVRVLRNAWHGCMDSAQPHPPHTHHSLPSQMQAPRSFVDPFASVVEAERKGETVQVKVKALNKGGLVVTMGETKGE